MAEVVAAERDLRARIRNFDCYHRNRSYSQVEPEEREPQDGELAVEQPVLVRMLEKKF